MLTFDTFYPSDIHITDQTLLLNIETTGLSPRNAFVFMIGLGWQEEKGWHFQCLLAEKKMDERELMQSFQQILENFSQVLTYGGHSFTYRFLNNRWRNYSDADCFSSEDTADLTLFQSVRQLIFKKISLLSGICFLWKTPEKPPLKPLFAIPVLSILTLKHWLNAIHHGSFPKKIRCFYS